MNSSEIKKDNILFMWILFFVYPLGSLFLAIKNFKYGEYRIFILLTLIFLGYTYIPIPDSDGDRNKQDFNSTGEYNFQKYSAEIKSVFNGTSDNKDYYLITVKFIALFISSNFKVYLLILSLLYFSIYLKFIQFVWDVVTFRNKDSLIYFIGICFVLNINSGLDGVRYPMAFWVFSFGAVNLIFKNQFKYLLIASLSVLIHFSLALSFFFLLLFYLCQYKNNLKLLLLLLVSTFVIVSIFPTIISSYLSVIGGGVQDKVTGYTNEDYIDIRENHIESWNWYIKFNFFSYYFFAVTILLLSKIKTFKINFDQNSNRLLGFSLFMLIQALLTSSFLDILSNRYITLVSLFGLVYLFYISSLNPENKFLKFTRFIFIPIVIINILVKLRADLYTVNTIVVFGNVIASFFIDINISIQNYLLG